MAVENRLFHWRCERRNIIKHHQTKWGANANKNQQKDPLCGIFQDSWQEFLTANPTSKQLTFQGPQKNHLSGDLVQHKAGAKRLDEKFQTAWCLVMAQWCLVKIQLSGQNWVHHENITYLKKIRNMLEQSRTVNQMAKLRLDTPAKVLSNGNQNGRPSVPNSNGNVVKETFPISWAWYRKGFFSWAGRSHTSRWSVIFFSSRTIHVWFQAPQMGDLKPGYKNNLILGWSWWSSKQLPSKCFNSI